MTKPSMPGIAVPARRWSWMARLGTLASNVADGMLAEGARQLAQGKRPALTDCTCCELAHSTVCRHADADEADIRR